MATSSTSSTSSSDLAAASTRLDALRTQLDKHNLQAYIVDSSDAHSNEYNAPLDDRRAYLSRFTGSAGTAIVLSRRRHDQGAFLWTDGRYHQQAATQLSPDWTLMKHGAPSVPSWTEWLSTPSHSAQLLPRGSRVGLDPALIAVADYTALAPALATAGVELVPVRDNLVDAVWDAEERAASAGQRGKPTRPREDVFVLGEEFAGEGARSKIERVRKELDKPDVFGGDAKAKTGDKRCWGLVVTQLDEIACAPLFSFAVVPTLGPDLTRPAHRPPPRTHPHPSPQGSSTSAALTSRTTPSSSRTWSSRRRARRARPSSSTSPRSRRRLTTT